MSLDLSNTASSLLKKLGGSVFYIIRDGDRPIDPDTGLPTGPKPQPTRTQVAGALVEYSSFELANSNIISGDKKLLLDPKVDCQQGDVIEIYDGSKWTVVATNNVNHAGILQLYELQIRSQ